MAQRAQKAADTTANQPRPSGSRAKRAAIAVLFSAILVIPRLRRLRRKPLPWTFVRLASFAAGACLIWRFARGHAAPGAEHVPGVLSLLFGIVLAAFGVLVRARPEARKIDAVASDLHALVVLNGGTYSSGDGAKPVPRVRIAVSADRLTVLTEKHQRVAEIPVAAIRRLSASSALGLRSQKAQSPPWQLELQWESSGPRISRFAFEGFFAEHLARVAEQTIASQWKKALPVLKS
jgi:hypothetical protein